MEKEKTRGGFRPGSGRKSKWKSGKTKAVKLPELLIPQILKMAHAIDKGEKEIVKNDLVNQSKKDLVAKSDNKKNLRKAANRYVMTLRRGRERQEAIKWINRFLKTLPT